MLPYWYDASSPTWPPGAPCWWPPTATACGRSIKHLDGISDDDIAELNLPTGVPIRYELGDDFAPARARLPVEERYLGDVEAARAAAEAVARQAEGRPCTRRECGTIDGPGCRRRTRVTHRCD